jgi:hypothetical protein
MATSPGVVVAVGSLSRAGDDEHFALTLSSGTSVTLPIAAVKRHRELEGPFCQRLVQVELELSSLPVEAIGAMGIPRGNGLALLHEGGLELAHAELELARALGHRFGALIRTTLERLSEVPPTP